MNTLKLPVTLAAMALVSAAPSVGQAAETDAYSFAAQQARMKPAGGYEQARERQRVEALAAAAAAETTAARGLAAAGRFDEADARLDAALKSLPDSPYAMAAAADINAEKLRVFQKRQAAASAAEKLAAEKAAAQQAAAQKQQAAATAERIAAAEKTAAEKAAARKAADERKAAAAAERQQAAAAKKAADEKTAAEKAAARKAAREGVDIAQVNPAFVKEQDAISKLLAKGRSQYAAADYDGAQQTYRHIESVDADNAEAKYFLKRIAADRAAIGELNRQKTTAQMMEEVTKAWQRPGLYNERAAAAAGAGAEGSPLAKKLNDIKIPSINFSGVELSKVVSTIAAITEDYDTSPTGDKGVNIVLIDQGGKNPSVTITVRNLPLKRVLDLVTESVGYQYEVQADTVVVRPGGETSRLETAYFAITRATVIRMTGVGGGSSPSASSADPFSAPSAPASAPAGGEGDGIRNFLSQAGVNFGEGTSLVYDGSAIIVTQTPRNLERIRNILNRYNDVRQVEIEAKFMDVQEGVLDELGVKWAVNGTRTSISTSGQSISDAFKSTAGNDSPGGQIVTPGGSSLSIQSGMPTIPGIVSLGDGIGTMVGIVSSIGNFGVDAQIRALSQKQGVDLMSAPKVTVLSGNPANIVVAQELRYPQSYGEIRSEVGTSSSSGNGSSAGVTITAGTPQDFTVRNIGVELKVTPTVEEDDYSISLDLSPKVTEFEGFVEYGGQSVAISGGTTVTVPSGVFQPIFSVREVSTKVTVWDGATLVMGGLTREEVKKVHDKVPILGDIPFIGRAFQSKGETSQKRNLLVFVTANLVSPGGSLKKQALKSVQPNTIFQSPTVTTPSGSEPRTRLDDNK